VDAAQRIALAVVARADELGGVAGDEASGDAARLVLGRRSDSSGISKEARDTRSTTCPGWTPASSRAGPGIVRPTPSAAG
jgi:hypothetical protein